jgi:stage III sporulation protein SpoIIIAA
LPKLITDDLDAILAVLPPRVRQPLHKQKDLSELLEIVLDLGRPPEARFPHREVILDPQDVTQVDIDYVTSRVSSFGDDNRAGIERTLHRISAIRNRKGNIIGLSLRVGRAVFGTIKIIEDLVESGKSVLLLGRPGIGKTTMLREVARVLADSLRKRVVIVDTSNEIAGDGDIPHPAIGHARRMQVTTPARQHAVMIEAVENHMPEVIVIDEIGTELEAQAARTIAERGVQLVGTAHGNTLENLMVNPTLSDLIGGIQAVTLGDEEARRRGTQKTILERKAPPTFDIIVEIQDRDRVAIHPDVVAAVDAALRGQTAAVETRWLDENGEVVVQKAAVGATARTPARPPAKRREMPRLFLFGINRHRFEQQSRELKITPNIAEKMADADMLLTSKNYYRRRPQKIRDAEAANLPVYVLKNHTPAQLRQFLTTIHPMDETAPGQPDSLRDALREAERAVSQISSGQEVVELSPQSAYIRRLQHLIAQRSDLSSVSHGQEPARRVTIHKVEAGA